MMKSLETVIAEVEESARNDHPDVLKRATDLVTEFPAEAEVWSLRAYIHERAGDILAAIDDVSRAMSLSPPEPSHYFDRGRYRLKLGDNAGAISDFDDGIQISNRHGDDYYLESLYFVRAEALVRVGRSREALTDLTHVRDDFVLWTTELQTKESLLSKFR